MKNYRGRVMLGFNLGVLIPTLFYFLSLFYYGFMSQEQLILSLTTPRPWMLFVVIYYPLLNLIVSRRVGVISNYLKDSRSESLSKVQKRVASLPRFYMFNVALYSILGASSLLFFEDFFTGTEQVLGIFLGFAFTFVYALPFFVFTVMQLEKWTVSVPLSEEYPFLTVKWKLYVNLFCNVFGVIVVMVVLNLGIVLSDVSHLGTDALFKLLLSKNLVLGALCLIIVSINLQMLSRQIVQPIKETTQMLKVISEGDLTQEIRVTSKDEIGILNDWTDRFIQKVHQVIGKVSQSAGQLDDSAGTLVANIDHVASSMNEMSQAADQIAFRAENTSETLSFVVGSLTSMDGSAAEIAEHSKEALHQGNNTVSIAQEGQRIVAKTMEKMDEIRHEMKYLVDTIEQVSNSVVKIEEIVQMISEISRKTNLLALNASIEAARVGSEGKGFMVVAQSIGKLSEESNNSVTEIVNLVDEIRNVASGSVDTTRLGMKKMEREMEWVEKTSEAFDQIYAGIRQTTASIQDIANATANQSRESKQIMESIQQVNDLAENVSALVEEQVATTEEIVSALSQINSSTTDSTSQTLVRESKELYKVISQFRVK